MPFLRFFVFAGLGLFGLLFASNYWLSTPQSAVVANAASATEPVKDALYYWRETEARNRHPIDHQFTVIPQTAIAMGKGIAVPQDAVVQASATTPDSKHAGDVVAANTTDKVVTQKPKKARRAVAQRMPSGVEQQQAYQQQQAWQQQRFRQANAQANAGGSFDLFSGVWR